jgi:DNA (cytosine-5)-methyltransferase 1
MSKSKTARVLYDKATQALIELAKLKTPNGSSPEATAHQWLHAAANDFTPYSESLSISINKILETLSQNGSPTTRQKLKSIIKQSFALTPTRKSTFRFIDLFAGIGGMRIGFQNAGGHCVFSSEFEKNAQETYFKNHGEVPFGDITKIPIEAIPEHDVLIAGFPCQPFSHAGLKLGIDDTRGTLFHDIARILEEKQPAVALLENVKGLISHDQGYTLQVILKTLSKIGYYCNVPKDLIEHGTPKQIQEVAKKMVLKSTDFGVPQNRQRIYIVLWKNKKKTYFEYPKPLGLPTRVGDILEDKPDPKFTISDRLWEGHQRRKVVNAQNGKGFGFGLVTPDSIYTNTISARYYKDGSEILIAQKKGNPRKLTPREAARLQGFPEEFEPSSSNMQAWKQFGNSVSVPVVAAIAKNIKIQLLN